MQEWNGMKQSWLEKMSWLKFKGYKIKYQAKCHFVFVCQCPSKNKTVQISNSFLQDVNSYIYFFLCLHLHLKVPIHNYLLPRHFTATSWPRQLAFHTAPKLPAPTWWRFQHVKQKKLTSKNNRKGNEPRTFLSFWISSNGISGSSLTSCLTWKKTPTGKHVTLSRFQRGWS